MSTRLPILLLASICASATASEARYFGLTPPDTPEPFEPSLLGANRLVTQVAIAPGQRLAAFSVIEGGPSAKVANGIHESRLRRGEWSAPARLDVFGAELPAGEGAFSPDGRWFYFSSDRTPGGTGRPRVFRAEVRNDVFGAPEFVKLDIPDTAGAYYPRLLANGDLFFTSPGPVGGDDLFVAASSGRGDFATPQPLSGDFNSPRDDWDLIESRDGRIRIWASARDGSLGKTDLWFSRKVSGAWSNARRLEAASTPALETAPALSPDDEVLFFLRRIDGRERLLWVRLAAVLEKS